EVTAWERRDEGEDEQHPGDQRDPAVWRHARERVRRRWRLACTVRQCDCHTSGSFLASGGCAPGRTEKRLGGLRTFAQSNPTRCVCAGLLQTPTLAGLV